MSVERSAGPARLIDVAERAGVSMKTVSNVINEYAHVSARTRERVVAAIEEVGYRPNLSARNLARGRAGVIALVVPQLSLPYFASLAGILVRAAEARGWFVLIHQTDGDPDAERAALAGNFPQRVDGMIVSSQMLDPSDVAGMNRSTPLVILSNREFDPGTPHVSIDNRAAGAVAVRHLATGGARRIALIGASDLDSPAPRTKGYLDGLENAGLPLFPELVRPVTRGTGDEGERATEELLSEAAEPPDGIVAITDWVAMGVMRALHRHGLVVPEDVSVIGFDDIPYARSLTPSLTTLAPDRHGIATMALDLLQRQMDQGVAVGQGSLQAGFTLIVRETTR
ncbi:LacI family DNA-binding transcriptional regulator [Brachybacterium sp.]|uniref:LacI family DNA-binding transcriptional regulator n=1 Tax=Brachybacterium sp. TaxID=1891286 RepID=UPI002ECFDCC5